MFWLPLYLQVKNGYSDYETASVASCFDVGCVLGSFLMGHLTDLTYCRRIPIGVLGLILGATFMMLMIIVPGTEKLLISLVVFIVGINIGGPSSILAGIAASDLVNTFQLIE